MPGVPPDALEQVKKALRSIFRRNKKPKDGTAAQAAQAPPPSRQQQQQQQRPLSARPLSQQMVSRVQTPEPATRLAAAASQDPSLVQETNGPSPLQEIAPVSAPLPTHNHPLVPQYANAANALGELSSFPRSPSIPALSHDEPESPPPEPQTSTEIEPTSTEAPIDSHYEVVHRTPGHDKEVIHSEDRAIQKEALSVNTPVEYFDSPQAEHTGPEHLGPKIAAPVEEPLHAYRPSTPAPEVPSKTESVALTADSSAPTTVSHDDPPHANGAARRAPPVYHDEKIPVMAELPNIRRMTPAPGMVATSGPLEDFPFR